MDDAGYADPSGAGAEEQHAWADAVQQHGWLRTAVILISLSAICLPAFAFPTFATRTAYFVPAFIGWWILLERFMEWSAALPKRRASSRPAAPSDPAVPGVLPRHAGMSALREGARWCATNGQPFTLCRIGVRGSSAFPTDQAALAARYAASIDNSLPSRAAATVVSFTPPTLLVGLARADEAAAKAFAQRLEASWIAQRLAPAPIVLAERSPDESIDELAERLGAWGRTQATPGG